MPEVSMANKRETEPNRDNAVTSIGTSSSDGKATSSAMQEAEHTAPRRPNGRFGKGKSGNPGGRPRGSRNAMSLLAQSLLDREVETIMRTLIERAKQGDPSALRLCVERLLPVKRERVVTIDLPPINCPADAKRALAAIIAAVAHGDLSPSEASEFSAMIDAYIRACGATDLADRLDEVQQFIGAKK
jgi:hypothetical protein